MSRYSEEKRKEFIEKVKSILAKAVKEKSIDAWFFNWADDDVDEKKLAEKLINDLLPGKWRFVHLLGNFTDFGEGWFCEDKYEVYIQLACFDEDGDECIDSFEVLTAEEVDYRYKGRENIENK